jgi:hypothetical protein
MIDPFPDVPEPVRDRTGSPDRNLANRLHYEQEALRRVCAGVVMPSLFHRVTREACARGAPGATFELFDALYRFPIQFRTGRLRYIRFISLADLFNRFGATPIGQELARLADEELDLDDGPIGLIFRWAGAKDSEGNQHTIRGGRFLVAHTANTGAFAAGQTARFTATVKLGRKRNAPIQEVTLERLDDLLAHYSTWQPAG